MQDHSFTLDEPAIRRWVREDEPAVPDGTAFDENPAAHAANLLQEAQAAGSVWAPEGCRVEAISVDELEGSGFVIVVYDTRGSRPGVGVTAGFTDFATYVDIDGQSPVLEDDGDRAVELLGRMLSEATTTYRRGRLGDPSRTERRR